MTRFQTSSLLVFVLVFVLVLPASTSFGQSPHDPSPHDPSPHSESPPKLIVVSWDGAPDWVLDRLLGAGKLPHLAALAERGAVAEHSVAVFPSKTAPGHAALWTGTWPAANGITANAVPKPGGSVLETRRGFSSEALEAEPLFLTAARQGKSVALLGATHYYPPGPTLEALRRHGVRREGFRAWSGFELEIARGRLIQADALRPAHRAAWGLTSDDGAARELVVDVGDTTFFGLVLDDPADPVAGFDTLLLRQGSRRAAGAVAEAVLKPRAAEVPRAEGLPRPWSPPFRIRGKGADGELVANTFFRLFTLSPDGGEFALYQRKASALSGISHPVDHALYLAAYPGFHDDPFWLYGRGGFGPTLMAGGDGTAERRVLEITAQDAELLARGTRFALEHWQPDVLFHYSPMSDSAGHRWVGVLDPESPAHDPALAAKLWPLYTRVFQQLDAWLGEIVRTAPPETVIALVSDHGMTGTAADVRVNQILENAGLIHRLPGGGVDLDRTKILAADSDFFLRLVHPEANGAEAVLGAASKALLQAHDPSTGAALFRRVFRRSELAHLGLDAPPAGDLYLDPSPGYYPRKGFGAVVVESQGPGGEGNHGFDPERRDMHTVFVVAGPGVRHGVTVSPTRHVDVAPTLARLLGLEPPAQAVGRVVEELLENP